MNSMLDQRILTNMAAVTPEIDSLQETETARWIGDIALDKIEVYRPMAAQTWPKYRRGYNYNVTETMQFQLTEIILESGGPGCAITLVVPEDRDEYFAGWVSGERRAEAEGWVAAFNRELDELRAAWAAGGFVGRNSPSETGQ